MTYYEILEVLPTASPEVIRMAYKALAKQYHPDVFHGNKEYAEMKMKQINEAYSVLSSLTSRQEYDKMLQWQKVQTQQTYQAKQTYQAPQPPKSTPVKKKNGTVIFWIVFVIIIAPILLTMLGAGGYFDEKDTQPVAQTSVKVETTPPPAPATIIPRSGDILSGSESFDGSELTITASSGSSCVVKLKTHSGVERLSFYVRAGDTVTVGVPAEYMYVYFASGDTWYGKKLLFGEDTYYSMDDELLDFTQYTWEYTLYPVTSGNFSETPIDPEDF